MTEPGARIDAIDIVRLVGPSAFARARDIVREGLVSGCVYDPALHLLTARVAGTAPFPYQVRVTLEPGSSGGMRPTTTWCTCPIGAECKHVAAALLTLAARSLAIETASATPGPPDWRLQVARLAAPDPAAPTRADATALGLQFEIRDIRRHTRLGVRPVSRSAKGNWVRGQLTWNSLPHSLHRLDLDQAQHAWFLQFAALHRSGAVVGVPTEPDWLHLDDFVSPLLWPLLDTAPGLGIPFVIGKGPAGVERGADAQVLLDVSKERSGAVSIRAMATLDSRTLRPGAVGLIGNHGIYTWRDQPARIIIAPVPSEVTDEERRLLVDRERITVPAESADEFVAEWSPRLRSTGQLVSTDGTLALPSTDAAELVLTARFESGDLVHLTWRWHIGSRRDPIGLHGPLPDLATLPEPPQALNWFEDGMLAGDDALVFMAESLPLLQQRDDLRVVVLGERPPSEHLTELPTLHLTTVESVHRDWFDLSFVVTVQDRLVPFVDIMTALASGRKRLRLIDNSTVSLANPMFDRLRELIEEARTLAEWEPGSPLRLRPEQAGLWSEFDQLAAQSDADERWRAIVGGLIAFAHEDGEDLPSLALPSGLHATLRAYQRQGYEWLSFLADHGLGGVLADDMGLGKTLQVLALIAGLRERHPERGGPFLVVAPTSVVSNWVAEAARFAPGLRVRALTTTAVKEHDLVRTAANDADVVVTSYALLRMDAGAYRQVAWEAMILDEAQFVKNPGSQSHRAVAAIPTAVRIALTGTPLENGLTDLWALFHIVAPGLLSSLTRFTEDYVKPLGSDDLRSDDRRALTDRLRRRIRPLMLRRTKDAVAADLPEKQEQVLRIDLDPAHRERYDRTLNRERLKLLDLVDDLDRHRMTIFRSLTLLRMLALSPALVAEDDPAAPSAKLDFLLDELEELAAEGRRALVFSQFTSFLGLVGDALDARGIAYEYLDGATRQRARVIDRFRSGTAPAFLISLKAAGFGLNLTEADTVFILDPWWNPAAEEQAIDRAHRIGQRRPVTVIRLIADNTIEEKVLELAAKKAALFDAMIDDDQLFAETLTAADVRELLR